MAMACMPKRITQLRGKSASQYATASSTRVVQITQRSSSNVPRGNVVAHAGNIAKITGEQLEVEIQDRDRPLIVDFYATWCGPCLLLAQELEKVAGELGDQVKVLKIDVDENPELSSQLQIAGLPTMVFIPKDAGRPALRTEGLMPAAQIIDIVKEIQTSK